MDGKVPDWISVPSAGHLGNKGCQQLHYGSLPDTPGFDFWVLFQTARYLWVTFYRRRRSALRRRASGPFHYHNLLYLIKTGSSSLETVYRSRSALNHNCLPQLPTRSRHSSTPSPAAVGARLPMANTKAVVVPSGLMPSRCLTWLRPRSDTGRLGSARQSDGARFYRHHQPTHRIANTSA